MADNVIDIRFVDASNVSGTPVVPTGGSRNGSPTGFGFPSGMPAIGNAGPLVAAAQFLSQLLAEVRVISNKISGGMAAKADPEKKSEKEVRTFEKMARFAEMSLASISRTIDVIGMRTQKTTDAAVARIRNEEQEARIAERERAGLTEVAAIRAAADAAAHIPNVSVLGNSLDAGKAASGALRAAADVEEARMRWDIKQMQEMLGIGRAMRARTEELARYDGGLARTMAIGDVNRQRRDVGEAQILSSQFSEVEARQQQLDKINQQLGILAKMKESGEQLKRVNDEMAERQKELNDKLDGLPAEMAKKIRELGEAVKDPFTLLEERAGFAGNGFDQARRENDLAARQQAARLNIPLLQ